MTHTEVVHRSVICLNCLSYDLGVQNSLTCPRHLPLAGRLSGRSFSKKQMSDEHAGSILPSKSQKQTFPKSLIF
jgi:hypothetical protein